MRQLIKTLNLTLKTIIVFIFSISIVSCSTGYHSKSLVGGYSSQDITPSTVKITYTGNAYTTPTQTYQYAMRRAAELAIARHFQYFIVIKNRTYHTAQQSVAANVNITSSYPTTELKVKFLSTKTGEAYTARKVLAQVPSA